MTLSPNFERTLIEAGADRVRAADVLALSDFYLGHAGERTPWTQAFAAPAYLGYFLPLNYARVRAVWREVLRFIPTEALGSIVDFGSGSGAVHFALEDEEAFAPRPLSCVERSPEARAIHRRLAELRGGRWRPQTSAPARVEAGAMAVYSYAFLEMQPELADLERFDHLLILEPSTRECGRQLMSWRQRLIDRGYRALAPCTHDVACPLLVESNKDWCHYRVTFEGPSWWPALEDALPMKNRTLTYSYLLMSRTVADQTWRGAARVIGDTLPERGKTRQLICRGPHREFLSWLHRAGEPPVIPRGALVRGVERAEPKGFELRVTESTHLEIYP